MLCPFSDPSVLSLFIYTNVIGRINGYTFDMDRMTSFEGDTGPYLQYAHARLCSIIRKARVPLEELGKPNVALLHETPTVDIIQMLVRRPDVLKMTYNNREPITVLTYLIRLTHVLNSSYDHLNIIKREHELKLARLALYCCVQRVLGAGMKLLGLVPVERYFLL